MTTPLVKRKSTQVVLTIFGLAVLPLWIWLWIGFIHQTHARRLGREWGVAIKEAEKLPPGMDRAEDMLSRLKRIDLGHASKDLKQAVNDYITAFQQSIDAAKAGQDTSVSDKAMDEAKQRMIHAMEKDA